jgi:MFS family permease
MRLLTTQDGLPRISWGAVIAGVILSLIAYLILTVLGTAIGASVLSPLTQPDPARGFAFGSGAYMIVMTVIAVFIGSYFAGRCAPVLGWLHGLLAWAVMIIVMAYGATSLVGSAVNAAGSIASTGATAAAAAGPSAASGTMMSSFKEQVQGAVASATAMASSPQAEADTRQAADTAARGVARASWFSFAALVVGAIIAIVSGVAGFRHQPPFEDAGGAAYKDDAVRSPRRTVPGSRPAH